MGYLQGGCGNPALSALFFCSFIVIITMILLNLFTAVVLENFQVQEEQAAWTLSPSALEVSLAMHPPKPLAPSLTAPATSEHPNFPCLQLTEHILCFSRPHQLMSASSYCSVQ